MVAARECQGGSLGSKVLGPPPLGKVSVSVRRRAFLAPGPWVRRILPRGRFPPSQGQPAKEPECPKSAPRAPQERTRASQVHPKSAQERPKSAQEEPKSSPRAATRPLERPKNCQERPKSAKKRPRDAKSGSGVSKERPESKDQSQEPGTQVLYLIEKQNF